MNLDYIFIFYDSELSYRRRIWEKYLYEFMSLDTFNDIMAQLRNPYECLVVKHDCSSTDTLSDMLFYL